MVTGLQSYNTSPASGFSVSFNEETSPHYTRRERQWVGRFCSPILKFVALTGNCFGFFLFFLFEKLLLKVNRSLRGFNCPTNPKTGIWRVKYTQQLKINLICFLLLNLLTACHPINSPNVLLCDGLPQGSKLKPDLLLQIFPQQTLGNVMCGNILLLYLLRKTPRGRCILLMLTLAPC